ncbi:efflux RND transporter periplasmic adaptor subunit [Parvibium lacunae]|uniref:HlyD family efflux transporter periplasmic adaptor subunit n=1 Tax=Parvibium lacunae TaxID=1888893 RepID=A0A368L0Q6_9BURK|nr:HlyD family efflux transporter periplasmic adaptor subunit [Parvibium lacunae]RCS56881.1 HlyD family efflux transporter periplasmic adaptor subunit [Parvibium lacunae]
MKPNNIEKKLHWIAFVTATSLVGAVVPSHAGEGHDHGATSAVTNTHGPQRMADGSVFLPKPAQRQLNVRTLVVKSADLPRSIELNGRVMMDPNAGGKVQPINAGRIQPGPKGLPNAGQAVRKGDVLGYVVSAAAPLEKASQSAQLAEIRAAKALTEKRLARLRELADTVPRKEIETAESELVSLTDRLAAVSAGLTNKEALLAPVSGVIASAQVVAGQVVDARELIFEIVDPKRLRIEALAFDSAIAKNVGGATLAINDQQVPLNFIGAARSLREQALPLNFQIQSSELLGLAVGQPVKVIVQSKQKRQGIPIPQAALMKNTANQNIVWVKTAPEKFEPRTVTFEPLDGVQVTVTTGLKSGDRVATQGATLINQVR